MLSLSRNVSFLSSRIWIRFHTTALLAILCAAASAALASGHSDGAAPSKWPSQPITLVVSYPPGGTADTLSRAIAEQIGSSLGQPIIVENKPGANGNIAAAFVAKSAPDGHTLLMSAPGPLAVNASVYASLPFDPKNDFAPIARVAVAPLVLVVPKALPVNSFSELRAYLEANPEKASFASQGNASSGHLAMELLKARTGLRATHVPYKGSAPALNDLLGGHVTMMFDNTTSSLPHVRAGQLRAIAVAEEHRIKSLPDVPTVAESGVPGFVATPWFGIVAASGTPDAIVEKLARAIRGAVEVPKMQERFAAMGVDLVLDTPQQFRDYIAAESSKWKEVVRISGAKAD